MVNNSTNINNVNNHISAQFTEHKKTWPWHMMFEIHVLVWNRNKTEEVQLINEILPLDKWFSNEQYIYR